MFFGSSDFTCLPHITSKIKNMCIILSKKHMLLFTELVRTKPMQIQIHPKFDQTPRCGGKWARIQASFGRVLGSRVSITSQKKVRHSFLDLMQLLYLVFAFATFAVLHAEHENETQMKSGFRPGQPGTPFAPAPGATPTTICRRWVDCVDGNWNNQRCTGGRYCRGGWEGGGNNVTPQKEKSGFRPGQPGTPFAPAPGATPTTICRRWVDCVDGNWNNQRCTGGRYCRGGWEGGGNNVTPQKEKSGFRPGQPGTPFAPAPGATPTTICRRWVDCVDGNWNNQRCTGGRYCRGGWEGGGNNVTPQKEKSGFRPGQPGTPFAPAPGATPTTICRRWVDCVDGNWNNQRCTGGRYCRGGWEGGGNEKTAEAKPVLFP